VAFLLARVNPHWDERRMPMPNRHKDKRSDQERDLARIIHSSAFRRLQGKTQLLGIGEGDFHRTRLTHSLEVAQIARGLVQQLSREAVDETPLLSAPLVEAIALAHDVGHPPFGHGGEVALNYTMRDAGGFEGNGQTLRLLAKLESHTEGYGLNPTRRTLLGVLKYPLPYTKANRPPAAAAQIPTSPYQVKVAHWKPPKCYFDCDQDVVDWILEPLCDSDRKSFTGSKPAEEGKHLASEHKSFDCSIMELADDIAYGVHDLEDAIALRLIDPPAVSSVLQAADTAWLTEWKLQSVGTELFKKEDRKRAIGALVHALISSVELAKNEIFQDPLLAFRAKLTVPAASLLKTLKMLVRDKVLRTAELQTLEYRGQVMLVQLFEALLSDPVRLMKDSFARKHEVASDGTQGKRIVCDYISGMTDEYACRMYERLFMPREGTIFERL
jgi:dGTPase